MVRLNKNPWERLQEETSRAYESFCHYRDIGPDRSITKVHVTQHQTSTNKSPNIRTLKEWSSKYQWVERAATYDDHVDDLRRFRNEQAIVEMSERHVRIARNFQDKIDERLQSINPNDLNPQDLARWYDTSVKIERISLGVPTENIKQEQELKEVKDESTNEALKNPETRKIASKLVKRFADSKTNTNRTGLGSN